MTSSSADMSGFRHELYTFFNEFFDLESKTKAIIDLISEDSRRVKMDDGDPVFWKVLDMMTSTKISEKFLNICLRYDIDVNARNWMNQNALFFLLSKINCQVVDDNELRGNLNGQWTLSGLMKMFSMLRKTGVDFSATDAEGNDILKYSLLNGQPVEFVEFLVQPEFCLQFVNTRNVNHVTPLSLALSRGDTRLVQLLLSVGAHPTDVDGNGNTVLHVLLGPRFLDKNIFDYVKRYAHQFKDTFNDVGQLPFTKFCLHLPRESPDEMFNLLLPSTEAINRRSSQFRDEPPLTPLEALINSNILTYYKTDKIEKLMAIGANVTDKAITDEIRKGNVEIVKTLLSTELKRPTIDHLRTCTENRLIRSKCLPCLKLVLSKLDVKVKSAIRVTYPELAVDVLKASSVDFLEDPKSTLDFIFDLLQENYLDPNVLSQDGSTFLHVLVDMSKIVWNSHPDIADFVVRLVEAYPNLNLNVKVSRMSCASQTDEKTVTPLSYAIYLGNYHLAIQLMKNFASLEGVQEAVKDMPISQFSKYDAHYLWLLRILKHLGFKIDDWDTRMDNLKVMYTDSQVDEEPSMPSTLMELTCLFIRKYLTVKMVEELLADVDVNPLVKEYLFLEHIKLPYLSTKRHYSSSERSSYSSEDHSMYSDDDDYSSHGNHNDDDH